MLYFLALLLGLALGTASTSLWWRRNLKAVLKKDTIDGFSLIGQVRVLLTRHRMESQAFKEKLEDALQLLAQMPLAYLHIEADNRVRYGNRLAWEILQYGVPEGRRLLLEVARSWELDNLVELSRRTGRPHVQDCTLYPTGRPCPLRAMSLPLKDGAVALFLEDRREAMDLTTQRDQWTVDVAHELKTPLTSIRLVLETLVNRVEPRHSQWLSRLLKEVLRMAQLVEDLLCLNQFSLDRALVLKPEPLDLVVLLQECWQVVEPIAQLKTVTLACQIPDHCWLKGDEAYLRRVFLNLLDNATKFSPQTGQLHVTIQPEAQVVALLVRDEGPGFPEEDLERVFQRFYRSDPARSRQTGGTGLGLALVREIVEAHGGKVEATNHPAGGAELRVQLPRIL